MRAKGRFKRYDRSILTRMTLGEFPSAVDVFAWCMLIRSTMMSRLRASNASREKE